MDKQMQQMKKGVLALLVLHLVAEQPTYGYALLRSMEERSGGMFALREGTLYPVLYRLEDEGLICARWEQAEGRATPKKYYEATDEGRRQLPQMQAQWQAFAACVQAMLQPQNNTAEEATDDTK